MDTKLEKLQYDAAIEHHSPKISLSGFNVFEKFEWVVSAVGDYEALKLILSKTDFSERNLDVLVSQYEDDMDFVKCKIDKLAWLLEGCDAFNLFIDLNKFLDCSFIIDDIVRDLELDYISQ